ncbi:cyclin-dependent kinase inhibitor 1 [Alligator mississippiensis]|nr:cyclin-dependent kinase inhibitor 1 [Alligator mississippiensis]
MESLIFKLTGEQQKGEKMMVWRPVKTNCVRRNLFGPVDHEQLQKDFQQLLRSGVEGAKQKWNFDFLREIPAEGLLQWEELQGHEVPAFYHSCVVGEARKPLQLLNRPMGKEARDHQFAKVTMTEKSKAPKKIVGKSQEVRKQRQASVTDYYSAKKRVKTNTKAASENVAF